MCLGVSPASIRDLSHPSGNQGVMIHDKGFSCLIRQSCSRYPLLLLLVVQPVNNTIQLCMKRLISSGRDLRARHVIDFCVLYVCGCEL